MQRGPQMFCKWCNPPIQLRFVPIAFPHGWHGFHLLVHRCPPDSSPEKKSRVNNWRLAIDFYSDFSVSFTRLFIEIHDVFTPKKQSGPWNFGRWRWFFFLHCPFQHLGASAYLPWDPFDLAKGGSRDETSKVANLEDWRGFFHGIFLWKMVYHRNGES